MSSLGNGTEVTETSETTSAASRWMAWARMLRAVSLASSLAPHLKVVLHVGELQLALLLNAPEEQCSCFGRREAAHGFELSHLLVTQFVHFRLELLG